jgi:hypothetical protein
MALAPSRAAEELKALRLEAEAPFAHEQLVSWNSRVRAVLSRALGSDADLVVKWDHVRYWSTVADTPAQVQQYRDKGVREANALLEAAIFELDLLTPQESVLSTTSFDLELWEHVESLISGGDWIHLPAAVAIFCEHKIRAWAGLETSAVGRGLYAKAMADDGLLRLGVQPSEWEGWRALGMGLAQAVGNVDLHRLEQRGDARAYAIGVLGLGSLPLTQMRTQHADLIAANSEN